MAALRLALAQVNSTVGDLAGNAATVLARAHEAAAGGADLVLFPEMMLTGYPPEDLVLRSAFRNDARAALELLATDLSAAGLGDLAVVVGYLDEAGGARNAAAFVHGGRVVARYYKHHLPNYGVFDERRYFAPGEELVLVRHRGAAFALTVCEDAWQDGGPFAAARAAGADVVLSINASPYERGKDGLRLPLLQRRAAEAGAPVVYVNAVGGQDELVFDGGSMAVAADGGLLLRAPQFHEGVHFFDLPSAGRNDAGRNDAGRNDAGHNAAGHNDAAEQAPRTIGGLTLRRADTGTPPPDAERAPCAPLLAPRVADEEEVWGALVTGLRDYVRKNGFSSVVLGLSGGIDSALVAAVAADALGPQNVFGVSLPSAYSSEHSRADAEDSARSIGLNYRTVPIASMVDPFVSNLALHGLAEENVQARVRGTTLMAISNSEGQLVLATGNKSELAVGYSTIYGDAVGGFAPIKDVPKTLVWQLARWRNAWARERGQTPPIPESSITKPPSAELRPGQLDTDSLPDYEVLDAIVERYVDCDESVAQIVAAGFEPGLAQRVAALIARAEWKRRQYPPGTKISLKSFGKDRRLPITNRWHDGAGTPVAAAGGGG